MKEKLTEFTICPMTEADLEGVLAIESNSFPNPWNRAHFLDELRSSYAFPLVTLGPEGGVIGYICPMLLLDEGHILDVAVHKDFRGYGLGKLLVERVIAECREGGADFVSLEVRPSNHAAIALYRKLGFKETGRRKRYYENGEDAIMMEYIFKEDREERDAV
ncbi:MAG: ribosomal-protein-alanine [Geobacteraceae bacterium]|nr:MAG: ribosomal-protein-alanine [Geobacteraceae bacterium]